MWIQAGGIAFNPDIVDLINKAGFNKDTAQFEIHFMVGGFQHTLSYNTQRDYDREFERILTALECCDLLYLQEEKKEDDVAVDPTAPDEDV